MRVVNGVFGLELGLAIILAGAVMMPRLLAQASAIPSAQARMDAPAADRGRRLLDEMVAALGGKAWLNRQEWIVYGRTATFYKGQPEVGASQFEEDHRAHPFGERVVISSHYGALIATDHADVAEIWTEHNGYEITYKGTKLLPAKDVEEYQRRRRHSLDVVVEEWLRQPGVIVTYDGVKMVDRHPSERVSILGAGNDAVVLELDQSTHLPLRLSFQWRDPVYNDWNTDVEEFANYHEVQGVMTPYTVTTLRNGDMTGEEFLTKIVYSVKLAGELFDPNQRLEKK